MEKQLVDKLNCVVCDKIYMSKAGYFSHLKKVHNCTEKEIDDIRFSLKDTLTVSEKKAIESRTISCLQKYGTTSTLNSEIVKNKIKQTSLERHGCENPGQCKAGREKAKRTTLERFGVECAFQSEITKEKIKETNLEKYGCENPNQCKEIHEKVKQTNLERYGCEYGLSNEEVKRKGVVTSKEKYGVKQYTQTPDFYDRIKQTHFEKYGKWFPQTDAHFKSNHKWKDYIMPSGKIIRIQGYEGLAIDYFLLQGIKESDFVIDSKAIVECIGELWYIGVDKNEHRYFPDIYIKSTKQLIEVKSKYTFYKNKDINDLKKKCAMDKGLKFEFMIIEPKTDEYIFC